MTKYFKIIVFVLLLWTDKILGQKKSGSKMQYDTLFIGDQKYPLQKTKIFYDGSQQGQVFLPSEYKEINNEMVISYKVITDSVTETLSDEQGNCFTILRPEQKHENQDRKYYLNSFLDTIKIKSEVFGDLVPFIKTGNIKIPFCSALIISNTNDTLQNHYYHCDRKIFDGLAYDVRTNKRKSTFIIHDLYYRRGNATFYLDRSFIILLKTGT